MVVFPGFQIKKSVRKKLALDESWFSLQGDLIVHDQRVAQQLAEILRPINKNLQASELNAFGLLHEIEHYLVAYYRKNTESDLNKKLETFFKKELGLKKFNKLLKKYCQYFPPTPVFIGEITIADFLKKAANRHLILEELMLIWIDNLNPAFKPIKKLIDPDELKDEPDFQATFNLFDSIFKELPLLPEEKLSLFELLQEPAKKFPHSIQAQLEFIAKHWKKFIGAFLKRLLFSLDFIKEEQKARFDKALFGPGPTEAPKYEEDFEVERFSLDEHWMPRLVLIAKSTYVWLDQLSKKYEQPITLLDQIPDEELERLARFGISGLWLIGIWERSRASQRIKQRTGNPEALASAYSLYDYVVAEDLGGQQALKNLKERAWRYGIRMATDMVPNHTGIDSKWIIEHPDWFIQLPYSPFPKYSFNGPDLCDHHDVGIFIEDGYWDRTDAAVVFKRVHYPSGDTRFIYHGNDGTSMPWNDTAQLNYLNPEVREAVIQKILEIARQFPIIRFDAAMTLTKKHFHRLWFPEPGSGGDIPSRAQFGMTSAEFDQHMPNEFWREVVDRVQQEAPDTLLLAEAFWLMEGYFVRTLGMHRVYNSAFMNMLKNEENDKFRLLIKNTLEFNPQILKRYVNFMNNPDEETAVIQFGKGDKYFGVCTMMATLPGLPMFGHGQLEGLAEKYGMEYRRAYWDEEEDSWLVQQHFRLIAPLLKKRYLFSDVENFLLYDLYTDNGQVNENVFAYSNRFENERALVIYNNSFHHAYGWIHRSAAFKKGDLLIRKTLWEGLNLNGLDDALIVFRDHVSGLHFIRELSEFKKRGLFVDLGGYKFQVYLDFQVVFDSAESPYRALCQRLKGRGVPEMQIALKEIIYEPLHQMVHHALENPFISQLKDDWQKANQPSRWSKAVKTALSSIAQPIAQFENQQTVKTVEIKHLTQQILNYFKIIESSFFNENDYPLPGNVPTFKILFDPQKETIDEVKFLHFFWTYRLLNAIYQQDQSEELFSERLLPQIFQKHLEALQRFKSRSDSGLHLLQILNLMPEGLPFNKKTSQNEQIRYLFSLTPVASFIKIHSFENVLYFNKEHFEELLFWLFVLHILTICKNPLKDCTKIKRSFKNFNELTEKAFLSGYQVEKFLASLNKRLVNKRK